ncbi:hypothetical protein [Prevotella sp. HCN-7019]|uniref:hypothetical protein n=1 Tax=Prevotella sp. HCN-7019 TaxID=3134668 RepID=UPI0030BE4B76
MKKQNEIIPFKNIRQAFYVYCDMIKSHGKGAPITPNANFYIGCIILSSIACEVGLKAILAYEKKPSYGHDLHILFGKLSPQMQEAIIQCTSYKTENFHKALLESKNNFIKWRYYYEMLNLHVDYKFIIEFFCAIKTYLDEIKPEA